MCLAADVTEALQTEIALGAYRLDHAKEAVASEHQILGSKLGLETEYAELLAERAR